MFNPLTFDVIIHMVGFRSTILSFAFCLSLCFVFVFISLFLYTGLLLDYLDNFLSAVLSIGFLLNLFAFFDSCSRDYHIYP